MGGSAEVNTAIWASLIAITGVLLSIYAVAIIMAFFMIFGLSRAVNQISRATNAVPRGEFSIRIPVRRRDQIGELQQSFNEMAAGLDRSVLAIAQKEVMEKELLIARQLQESLLPADIPSSDRVDFATLFQPSAAIGGDYFDILPIDEDRLVVVIADVSGHGLHTGLRMAMLKAALVILVQEHKPPDEIFRRLSAMVRSEQERRFFVTSTLAVVRSGAGRDGAHQRRPYPHLSRASGRGDRDRAHWAPSGCAGRRLRSGKPRSSRTATSWSGSQTVLSRPPMTAVSPLAMSGSSRPCRAAPSRPPRCGTAFWAPKRLLPMASPPRTTRLWWRCAIPLRQRHCGSDPRIDLANVVASLCIGWHTPIPIHRRFPSVVSSQHPGEARRESAH